MAAASSIEATLCCCKGRSHCYLGSHHWAGLQVVAMLVSEIVLCIKEVNKRTRIAAYELLVGLARGMHEANPPPMFPGLDAPMGIPSSPQSLAP